MTYFSWGLLTFAGLLITPAALAQPTSLLPDSLASAPDTLQTWTLREMGDSLVRISQLTPAKQAYDEALTIALAHNRPADIGRSYRGVGYWYMQVNDYQQAISHYQKALGFVKQAGVPYQVARTLNFIGSAYIKMNDLKMGRAYMEQAFVAARQAHKPDLEIELTSEMAVLEGKSNRHDRALILNQKIADYYKQQKDTSTYYGSLFNLAITHKNLKNYARAETIFRDILAYSKRTGDVFYENYVYANMPNALIPLGKLDEAEVQSKQLITRSETSGAEKFYFQEEAYDMLSRIEKQRGNYKQALTYYQKHTALHDSVFNATRNRQLAETEARFQTQEKEAQIRVLDTLNAQKTRQVWAGVGGMLLLSILLGTLFILYQRIGRNRAQIQQQADQLTILMRELHHRVKNNLAIVSSLLRLQSSRMDDEKAIAAVRVGQQRVEAMALIHQRLYQTDNVSSVNMREFLTDLSESLMRAYGYAPDDFDLQLDIEQSELDVDVAMPLGLIVNELITNAFKYAYTNVERPLLRIGLQQQTTRTPGLTLEVQDNGPGLDTAAWQKVGERTSFGRRLIQSLTDQLDGEMAVIRQNGTLFRLHIPQTKLRAAA